ncbi:40S ribosomal protein S3 [Datura stramonium]|uniref:40S ribosomal protein S3 n=1 Tax=Datura stramonium TaxID=4076 RepID=A0ABS8TJ32_DATST|nr:40S ribosomal protein S3 [Datura stramonium]
MRTEIIIRATHTHLTSEKWRRIRELTPGSTWPQDQEIMLDWDPKRKQGPTIRLPDLFMIHSPKEEDEYIRPPVAPTNIEVPVSEYYSTQGCGLVFNELV